MLGLSRAIGGIRPCHYVKMSAMIVINNIQLTKQTRIINTGVIVCQLEHRRNYGESKTQDLSLDYRNAVGYNSLNANRRPITRSLVHLDATCWTNEDRKEIGGCACKWKTWRQTTALS